MGRTTATTLNDGYTLTEVLISISISLVLLIGVFHAYIAFSKGQHVSIIVLHNTKKILEVDELLRDKTSSLKVSYWENPMKRVTQFVTEMYSYDLPNGATIIQSNYLFKTSGHISGLEFLYTVHDNKTVYSSKCLFSFYPLIQDKGNVT